MKNSKYFPFERNRYFYGKLLSVNDFNLEQKYINDKRRMTNRFLFGTGIINGLQTIQLDEKTILIEKGFALDSYGREIVIDEDVIKKIETIDGFQASTEDTKADYIYLGLAYNEILEDQVHNIAGKVNEYEDKQFNKIRESYQLFLTSDEPDNQDLSIENLYEDIQQVYFQNGIKIRHCISKFGTSNQKVSLRVEIENTSKQYLTFSYDLVLSCMSYESQARIAVNFDEKLYEKTGQYCLSYDLDISDVNEMDGTVSVDPSTVKLTLDKKKIDVSLKGENTIRISQNEVMDAFTDSYRKRAMDSILENAPNEKIYLAKLFLIKADTFYVIDHIQTLPFKQYVLNNELAFAYAQMMKKNMTASAISNHRINQEEKGKNQTNTVNIFTGQYTFSIEKGQKNHVYFSEEIVHHLGLGNVSIVLSLDHQDCLTSGEMGIFDNVMNIKMASQLYKEKGSFVIGIKCLEEINVERITIDWTAIQNEKNVIENKIEKRILINPSVLELNVRETYIFEAICKNMIEKAVKWKVKEGSGTIDSNGLYTAPNTEGVYEITAESVAYPEVKASIYVVVRAND